MRGVVERLRRLVLRRTEETVRLDLGGGAAAYVTPTRPGAGLDVRLVDADGRTVFRVKPSPNAPRKHVVFDAPLAVRIDKVRPMTDAEFESMHERGPWPREAV